MWPCAEAQLVEQIRRARKTFRPVRPSSSVPCRLLLRPEAGDCSVGQKPAQRRKSTIRRELTATIVLEWPSLKVVQAASGFGSLILIPLSRATSIFEITRSIGSNARALLAIFGREGHCHELTRKLRRRSDLRVKSKASRTGETRGVRNAVSYCHFERWTILLHRIDLF